MPASSRTSSHNPSARAGFALTKKASTLRLNRRDALAAITAGVAAAFWSPALLQAATDHFRRKVGATDVMVVSDGTLSVPLSFMLPDTPPAELSELLAAHGLSLDWGPSQTNVTVVRTGKDLVLIDAGSGANFQPTAGRLGDNLQTAGLDPALVTRIVFTHAHADHLWGVIDELDEERFPNASYVISSGEWDFWTDPKTLDSVPDWLKGMAQAAARILKRIEGRLERRNSGDAVAPGMTFVATHGHTPGHMSVLVEDGGERLLVGGDVLSHSAISFAKPEWRIGSDQDSDRAVEARKRLLDQLALDRTPLIGFHLPWPGHGMVERKGLSYRFIPA